MVRGPAGRGGFCPSFRSLLDGRSESMIAVLPVFAIRIHSYGCISLMLRYSAYCTRGGGTKGGKNVRRLLQPPFYKRIARSGERVIVVVGTDP